MSLIKIKQYLNDFAERFIQGMKDKSTANAYQLLWEPIIFNNRSLEFSLTNVPQEIFLEIFQTNSFAALLKAIRRWSYEL